ncbi:ABC transporter ATP-binding protein [Jatrophihabitans sp. YIM 134969]
MAVIDIQGLSKTYRARTWRRAGRRPATARPALDHLDLLVEEGGVHGFLGPNGSGKTTTIRVLLGLVRADAGAVRMLGREIPRELPRAVAHVGALVETPLFVPAFSGRRNLELLARVGGVGAERIEECLEIVDLRERATDRFGGYSLGMKQRLGIAAALLKTPRLLILDEPSNGLDPAGIRDVRELVRRLGSDGHTTVLLSSHLLGEISQVCDRVSVLARGRCVASGPVAQILGEGGATGGFVVGLPDLDRAAAVLTADGLTATPSGTTLVVGGTAEPGRITRVLAAADLWVEHLTPATRDLEQVFLDLTEAGRDEQPAAHLAAASEPAP